MGNFSYGFKKLINHHIRPTQLVFNLFFYWIDIIGCGSNSQKPRMLNSRSINKEEFIIIVAFTDKDPWMKAFSGLFVEPCCD